MGIRTKLTLSAALASLLLLSACHTPAQPSESVAPPTSQSPAVEVVTTPEPTPTPTPTPEPSEPVCPTLANMREVSAFLNEQVEQGNLELSLIYKGNSTRINDQSLMEVPACLHVGVERDAENRKMFHITVTPYPGDHITNVIKLDGAWYIVDATFDDSPNVLPYFMFNVGVDLASEHYSWGVEAVDQPLAETSDEHYYYYMEGNELDAFDTQAAAAEHIINLFRKEGQTEIIVLLRNQDASATAFNQQLNQAAERKNLSCG